MRNRTARPLPEETLSKYGKNTLAGGAEPSRLYPFMLRRLGHLLEPDKSRITKEQIRWRRKLNPVIKRFGSSFLQNRQVIENRKHLRGIEGEDTGVILLDSPVI